MFSWLVAYLRETLRENAESSEIKELEEQKKLKELLAYLREDGKPNQSEKQDNGSSAIADSSFNCTKSEGVVTSLHSSGGVINGKYPFSSLDAQNNWTNLKVGSKLSFVLFQGLVKRIDFFEPNWDEIYDNFKIPEESNAVGYRTDKRTIAGTISNIHDRILMVDTGRDQEVPVSLDDHPDLKWKFQEGDNVSLDCIIQEDDETWNPNIGGFGNILTVEGLKPSIEKHEIGRVSDVKEDYIVIDRSVIVSFEVVNKRLLKLNEEYEYKAIECSCLIDGINFYWRATELLKKIECDSDRNINNYGSIELHDVLLDYHQEMNRELKHSIPVYNNSSQPLTLLTCNMTSNSGLIRLNQTELNMKLSQFSGKFNIYLMISPRQVGSFVEELELNFGSFQKKCLITLIVRDEPISRSSQNNKVTESGEIVPGRKPRAAPRFIEIRMKSYGIPKCLSDIDFKKRSELVIDDLQQTLPFLFEELKKSNYVDKMHYCNYMEEIMMGIQFENYKMDRAHFETKNEYLKLEMKNVVEKRPSISLGDSIYATEVFTGNRIAKTYQGWVYKVEHDAVLFKFSEDFHHRHSNKDYSVKFNFSRTQFIRQHHALEQIVSHGNLGYDFLFPLIRNFIKNPQIDCSLSADKKIKINGRSFEFFSSKLNDYQKTAVVNVLRGESRPLPHIIYGPPGTGKTSTVVECIEQIIDKMPWARIIVATPSNSAANLIADRLLDSGRIKGGDFIRFVSMNQIEKEAIPEHLKKYCGTIDLGHDDGKAHNFQQTGSGMRLNCSKSIIVQNRVCISTVGTLGALLNIKFKTDHFTHVIIDEAGQLVETESIIPMTLVTQYKGQIILAGDPQQLGPVIISQVAKFCGFDKSFLERLSEHDYYLPVYGVDKNSFDDRFVTKLKKNYRSIPSILDIYNKLFYRNELEAEVSIVDSPESNLLQTIDAPKLLECPNADLNCGVYFINVAHGRNMRRSDSCSWCNNEEAAKVYLLICSLKRQGIDTKDIGVITPYALQVREIRSTVNDTIIGSEVKIGTVEEFQGQERKIIIVSTVRTDQRLIRSDKQYGMGFLQCAKRMNVAVSRARSLLVVFGKESVLAGDDNWRYLIQYAKEKGCYSST